MQTSHAPHYVNPNSTMLWRGKRAIASYVSIWRRLFRRPWAKGKQIDASKTYRNVCLYALIATLSACTGFANNSSSGAATAAAGPSKFARTASGQTVATNSGRCVLALRDGDGQPPCSVRPKGFLPIISIRFRCRSTIAAGTGYYNVQFLNRMVNMANGSRRRLSFSEAPRLESQFGSELAAVEHGERNTVGDCRASQALPLTSCRQEATNADSHLHLLLSAAQAVIHALKSS